MTFFESCHVDWSSLDMSCYVWSFNKRKILHQEKPSNKLNSNHDEESTWQSIRNSHFSNKISEKKYQTTTITINDDLRDNPDSINQIEVLLIPQLLVSRIRFCQCHWFKSSLPRPLTPLLPLNFQTSVIRLRIKFNCTVIDARYCGQIIKITQR